MWESTNPFNSRPLLSPVIDLKSKQSLGKALTLRKEIKNINQKVYCKFILNALMSPLMDRHTKMSIDVQGYVTKDNHKTVNDIIYVQCHNTT